jgi:hypothetical protein
MSATVAPTPSTKFTECAHSSFKLQGFQAFAIEHSAWQNERSE